MMTTWIYDGHPSGRFIVNIKGDTFVQEPKENTLTVEQLKIFSQNNKPDEPPKVETITQAEAIDRIVLQYAIDNNLKVNGIN